MGSTVWIGWPWFLCLWKETVDGCSARVWLGVDGVSVLYAECRGAGCNAIFLSLLSDDVKFMDPAVLRVL